jgi:hydrogenase/urease accessory protein HupE
VAAIMALVIAGPALAEIALAPPADFWNGLRGGLRAPVVGLAQLAAVFAVGCLAHANGGMLIAGYVLLGLVGAAAHIGERTVPNIEVFVALSAVALGLFVFRKSPLRRDIAFALCGGVGLLNGYWLGAAIALAHAIRSSVMSQVLRRCRRRSRSR